MNHNIDLLILDFDLNLKSDISDTINWANYYSSPKQGIFSMPEIVEQNSSQVKDRYLKLIFDFGEIKVNDKRIIDHLAIRKNFSFWWTTLIVEKSNYAKSPQIDNIIKLIALEEWLKERQYKKIKLVSPNNDLALSLSLLLKKVHIEFEWIKQTKNKTDIGFFKRFFFSFPLVLQGLIWLIYFIISNWQLRGVGLNEWQNTKGTTTFVSYLFNLEPIEAKKGKYQSKYWTKLSDLMRKKNYPSNWLHLYIRDDLLPSAKKARKLIQRFNSSKNTNEVHVALSSFLTFSVIYSSIKDWIKVLKSNKIVSKKIKTTSSHLWPLFKKDYEKSIYGISAISNILDFNLFEKAMTELPEQNRGCYLQENIGWEFGFISCWKSAGHKENLIGFPSSTVAYWDLRRFFDPRIYFQKGSCNLPLPNFVGVNGKITKNIYIDGGYPEADLIELESLRYLYLKEFNIDRSNKHKDNKEKVVLVVGDYLYENVYKQLTLLQKAQKYIDESIYYILKPHPACKLDIKDFPGITGEVSNQPLDDLMKICNLVYSSLITSAAVDAYCAGIPVITFLDGNTLNVSPLRGVEGVYFVCSARDLGNAINSVRKMRESDKVMDYFYLDLGLHRWDQWLSRSVVIDSKIDFKS